MTELEKLIEEQRADDSSDYIQPEIVGGLQINNFTSCGIKDYLLPDDVEHL